MAEVLTVASWAEFQDAVSMALLPGQEVDLVLANGAQVRVVVKSIRWPGEDDPDDLVHNGQRGR
jgi:hypothetical protein